MKTKHPSAFPSVNRVAVTPAFQLARFAADWKSAIRQIRNLRYGALAVLLFCAASCLDLSAATFTVTTTNDTGAGSLRAAITSANGGSGTNTIAFSIPPFDTTVKTITPASQLPFITRPVIIDGYTQTNSSANTETNADDAVLLIELNGGTINGGNGLVIAETAGGTTIRGLVIDNNWSVGINVQASNVVVEGCFIGTDASGLVAHGNNLGITTQFGLNIPASRIGGTSPPQRNVISGNAGTGILLQGGTNHAVQGNFLGTDATGTNALAQGSGVSLYTGGNLIGGTNAAARNVIAATSAGVSIAGGAGGNRIQGNFIGTDVNGSKALGGGGGNGIYIGSGDTLIGGLTSVPGTPPGNVISGNRVNGIVEDNVNNTTIQGNLIGLDATGSKPLGNTLDGVGLFGIFNVIGGTNVTARNVISANGRSGLEVGDGNVSVHDNLIQNNFIGTDITGTNLLGNANDGIFANRCFSNSIQSNVIAGNHSQGVEISASSGTTTSIAVLGNSIFDNAGLGISLSFGANNSQTNAVITSIATGGGNVSLGCSLKSASNAVFHLEFFSNAACDASGFGEGQVFLGATNLTTDASGNLSFIMILANPAGHANFTATATDTNGNSSAFSPCVSLLAPRITSISSNPSNHLPQIIGLGERNFTYGIEAASNLNSPVFWQRLGSTTADGAGVFLFSDTNAAAFPMRFYRPLSP